jgi:hypothetical protein
VAEEGREAAMFDLLIFPKPSERLCTQKTWLEHCILTRGDIYFRSAGRSNLASAIPVRSKMESKRFAQEELGTSHQ